jgi:hypothetical protein
MLTFTNSIENVTYDKLNIYFKNRFISRSLRSTFLTKTKLKKKTQKSKILSFQSRGKLKFDLLNVFYTLIIYGNIRLASERLFISQPAINLCINKLEKEIGALLFQKLNSKKSLKLTSSGLILFNYTQRLFQITQETIDLSNFMLLGLADNKLKSYFCTNSPLLNKAFLNNRRNYPKQRFSTFTIMASSLNTVLRIKSQEQKIFETKSKFLLVRTKFSHSKKLIQSTLGLSNKVKLELLEVDKLKPIKLLNKDLVKLLHDHSLIEIQSFRAITTCIELEISNLVFWGSEI